MTNGDNRTSFLDDIEIRQDDLLLQLDQLNSRVEQLLTDVLGSREDQAGGSA